MLIDKCPHCEAAHVQTIDRWKENFDSLNASTTDIWRIQRCQNPKCAKLILIIVSQQSGNMEIYPARSYELNPDVEIPEEIREDFREAGKCLSAGCNKASMVMSRRALQRCLKEQGCEKDTLVQAIDYSVEQNILRPLFHDLATEVRKYGNLGAHPDDDELKLATPENAEQILEFVRLLIHDFYEVPAAADNLRKNRES